MVRHNIVWYDNSYFRTYIPCFSNAVGPRVGDETLTAQQIFWRFVHLKEEN